MGKRSFLSCMDVIEYMQRAGFEKSSIASKAMLMKIISLKIASVQATKERYFDLLQEFELIIKKGDDEYEINFKRYYELQL